MTTQADDLWAEIIAEEKGENPLYNHPHQTEPVIAVVYRRQKPSNDTNKHKDAAPRRGSYSSSGIENRLSLAPVKRVSWNRSLSTRGRTSIAATLCVDHQPQRRKPARKAKPPLPRGKGVQPPNYEKERAYFKEIDSFELLEESPSPKRPGTWTMGVQQDNVMIPHLSSVLQKWLISRKLHQSYGQPRCLFNILETPELAEDPKALESSNLANSGRNFPQFSSDLLSRQSRSSASSIEKNVAEISASLKKNDLFGTLVEEAGEHIEVGVGKLSLTSRLSSLDGHSRDASLALLAACGQSSPSSLLDLLLNYCDTESIVKVGEGTYGEAFRIGENVCKIVPFNGDLRVNGEVQKKSYELLEEVVLSCSLNHLRGDDQAFNACTTFIQTIDLRVCQGTYDAALIRAWEDWDRKHGSENDHPKEFPEDQCYVAFVQEHGGQDLESFVLLNFDEARTLLVQVTYGLAVAEAAYEFEHRDLHWGNILLSRKDSEVLQFILEGRQIFVKTFGLTVSIIDFTLSRINTGEHILFLDLSSDPELFEGPRGDKQFDTYRKMRDITNECWEGSFPKTNVLWLQYLVDILLLRKSYDRTSKHERELRSLKKRLNNYGSAREATTDPFFNDLLVSH